MGKNGLTESDSYARQRMCDRTQRRKPKQQNVQKGKNYNSRKLS